MAQAWPPDPDPREPLTPNQRRLVVILCLVVLWIGSIFVWIGITLGDPEPEAIGWLDQRSK